MAVLFVLDFDRGTTDDYDYVIGRMQLSDRMPPGGLFHGVGATDRGLRVVDVWESAEVFGRFADEQIGPFTAERGMAPPRMRAFEVAQMRGEADRPVTFLQFVTIPGLDRAAFAALDDRVLGESGFPPEGCVFHVNGPIEGGRYVMDAWATKGHRDRFLEHNIKPAVAASGVDSVPAFEELDLHNSMRAGSPVAATV